MKHQDIFIFYERGKVYVHANKTSLHLSKLRNDRKKTTILVLTLKNSNVLISMCGCDMIDHF